LGSSFIDGFFGISLSEEKDGNYCSKRKNKIGFYYLMKMKLLNSFFFKAYAVEADIRLLAFYLHLPDREGLRFLWDELAKTRPEATGGRVF
jgi:hypothetical protein